MKKTGFWKLVSNYDEENYGGVLKEYYQLYYWDKKTNKYEVVWYDAVCMQFNNKDAAMAWTETEVGKKFKEVKTYEQTAFYFD